MKYCPRCNTLNEDDALFCKRCDFSFENDYDDNVTNTKVKTKTMVKRKGGRDKTKVKYKEGKPERKMSFFQKFMMFFFILLCIVLIGACGILVYHIYETENIDIPNVIGESYDDACQTLREAKLNCSQTQKIVEDKEDAGIVLKQSGGSKAAENEVIKLTVGVLDNRVTVPNVKGMSLEDALAEFNKEGVKYKLEYEESNEDENTVLGQSVRGGKKIENTETVTLIIAKAKEEVQGPEESPSDDTLDTTNEGTNTANDTSDTTTTE